jgi:hypothetical protein
VTQFGVLLRHLSRRTEENNERSPRPPVLEVIFEQRSSMMQSCDSIAALGPEYVDLYSIII